MRRPQPQESPRNSKYENPRFASWNCINKVLKGHRLQPCRKTPHKHWGFSLRDDLRDAVGIYATNANSPSASNSPSPSPNPSDRPRIADAAMPATARCLRPGIRRRASTLRRSASRSASGERQSSSRAPQTERQHACEHRPHLRKLVGRERGDHDLLLRNKTHDRSASRAATGKMNQPIPARLQIDSRIRKQPRAQPCARRKCLPDLLNRRRNFDFNHQLPWRLVDRRGRSQTCPKANRAGTRLNNRAASSICLFIAFT